MNILTQTSRFIIRRFKPEEEEMYTDLFNDARVMRYLPFRSRDDLVNIFRQHLEEGPAGSITGRWGLFTRTENGFMGMCLLRPFDDGSDSIELGYVLRYKYWGKGIGAEMANALLAHMLTIQPDAKFVAVTDMNNIASHRVLEKAGMHRDGDYVRSGEQLALFKS